MPLARELQNNMSALQVAGLLGSTNNAVAGAGTTQATATAMSAQFNIVTTGAALSGVVLPATMQPGDEVDVVNNTAVNICCYPPTGGKLNGNTANNPLVMAPGQMHFFQCIDGTSWAVDAH